MSLLHTYCSVMQCVVKARLVQQKCGAVYVMQCVAVCCSVLQCALQCVAVCCNVLQCVAVCCSVLQCVAVCCSVRQCVAVCCSVLQRVGQNACVVLHHSFIRIMGLIHICDVTRSYL